jgi:hypothetical protein
MSFIHRNEKDIDEKCTLSSGHSVGVTSLRLRTFKRDFETHGKLVCVNCGLNASFCSIDTFKNSKQQDYPHINIYGVNESGHDVLFTHDHTLARGLGGANALENATTMCGPCNWKKGDQEGKIINQARFDAGQMPYQLARKKAHQNPTRAHKLEAILNAWVENKQMDEKWYADRVDNLLCNHGWKRIRLLQAIADGEIKFDAFPIRPCRVKPESVDAV